MKSPKHKKEASASAWCKRNWATFGFFHFEINFDLFLYALFVSCHEVIQFFHRQWGFTGCAIFFIYAQVLVLPKFPDKKILRWIKPHQKLAYVYTTKVKRQKPNFEILIKTIKRLQ